jgi:hypothetical protein
MSNRETYEEAKKTLSQINLILATEPLTAKQRKEFEHRAANLAGIILRLAPRPSGVRKLLIFVISTAMLIGGLYLSASEVLLADIIYFRFVIGGAVVAVLGAYLLWTDIVTPMLGIKTAED